MPCRMTDEERRLQMFETPPHYIEPLLALIGPLDGLRIYEPCVGKWHIARYLTAGQLVTNDIDPACAADTHQDAREAAAWPLNGLLIDWTITNPPFSDEAVILAHALRSSRNVAFLARLSFLEPTQTRTALWQTYQPSDLIVLPRYSFRHNDQGKRQTDSVTCCWLVFRAQRPPCVQFSYWRPQYTTTVPALAEV
jgi:hypothetical protein